ncbi:tryptophan synthase beta subunit-like PLP-dependent enzyme [Punctularia strigosozonata HHB-11173 SS5]|uniref:tryptophan synthase beta subunit-like PLP-dependent enzyme n=1 Tax=Punctularia strigosozonata (strain HHB-11173) TaxID=741275 RepID=UPI00044172D3|nr:tryptophan synthase beta subunit-like PLP-dependent enzyme [Punctularia strigosozonata HHB-11173 SS5]EIN07806.1 tryptophan synthase beta subunit-like PLP-dependent enzyme [Punctularia strigosozonata HHB-11173 SS5]
MSVSSTSPDKAGLVQKPLYLQTPLIRSSHISSASKCDAYLKLESFKARGISSFVQRSVATHGASVHIIIASGGNAGLAAAWAAHALMVRCTVFLPESASRETIDFLHKHGAEVVIEGKIFLEALAKAEEVARTEDNAVVVPAYDDLVLWQGHASMITEIQQQFQDIQGVEQVTKPDAIFCSVGGAGLLGGVLVGLKQVGWEDIPVVAVETHGSNCFEESLRLNRDETFEPSKSPNIDRVVLDEHHRVKVAHLKQLTSKATSLGASSPSAGVVKLALQHPGGVASLTVSDEMAMWASERFAEDHKTLVELACSATLTPAYSPDLLSRLLGVVSPSRGHDSVKLVFIVCGGFKVSLADLAEYQHVAAIETGERKGTDWKVRCNAQPWDIPK